MDFIEQAQAEADVDDLGEDVVKSFKKYNANISIIKRIIAGDRFVFIIKLKGNTREAHIRAHAPDVQLRLKLPLFYVDKYNFNLCLIASRKAITHSRLPAILNTPGYQKAQRQMQLPYVVGYDVLGRVVMDDLARFPHLLLGGSTNSGKSVGLQALITNVAYKKSPSRVNFILIDVGANDLMPFEGLPHLSCPVVRDRAAVTQTLAALKAEMERRVELEHTDPSGYARLPRLVVVIDEFPALLMGLMDTKMSKTLAAAISSLLQRGRHAKIHLVLAAQNPTYQNMKVDLGNIPTRIAFRCAKKNFSEVILGEGGAENLLGKGELLLKSPQYDGLQRVQGVYITRDELLLTVQEIRTKFLNETAEKFDLVIPDGAVTSGDRGMRLSSSIIKERVQTPDKLLASVISWALGRDYVSINSLKNDYSFGWDKASKLIKQLEELGIVEKVQGKTSRQVIPTYLSDLPDELVAFLNQNGVSDEQIYSMLYERG